jgi:four helix bundle protein
MMTTQLEARIDDRKPVRSFRDLKVWEKAFHLTVDVHRLTEGFPEEAPSGLSGGMREAAVNMTTQIAQGQTHSYLKDFLRCLDQSLAALSDLETRVLLAGSLQYLEAPACAALEERISEVRRMEWGLVNRLRAKEEVA